MSEWFPNQFHFWQRIPPPKSLEEYHASMARRFQPQKHSAGTNPEQNDSAGGQYRVYDLHIVTEPSIEPRSSVRPPNIGLDFDEVSGHIFGHPATGEGATVEIRIYRQRPADSTGTWLEVLHVFATHDDQRIGDAMAFFVDRNAIRPRFMEKMFAATGVLRDIAAWIFDRYGCLRAEHQLSTRNIEVYHWGRGLDNDAFLVLHSFCVVEKWCQMGLAKKMIDCLVQKARAAEHPAFSVLAVPGFLPPKSCEDLHDKVPQMKTPGRGLNLSFSDVAKYLLCSMGFRRIGSTPCFAVRIDSASSQYSVNATFSRNEIISLVRQNQRKWVHGPANKIGIPFGNWEPQVAWFEREKEQFPLLHAAATIPDGELEYWFIENRNEYRTIDWLKVDNFQRNVLHLAAIGLKWRSVAWLLQWLDAGICSKLKAGIDMRAYTPLEELYWRLETMRTTDGQSALSDQFDGFSEGGELCLAMLKCLELPKPGDTVEFPRPTTAFWADDFGEGKLDDLATKFGLHIPLNKLQDGEDTGGYLLVNTVEYTVPSSSPTAVPGTPNSINGTNSILKLKLERVPSFDVHANGPGRIITRERLKYGCSCNMCLGGVISQRMRFILFTQAAFLKHKLELRHRNSTTKFTSEYCDFWTMMDAFWTEKVSLEAAQSYRLSTSRQRRDAKIFRAISRVMGDWNLFPELGPLKDWLSQDGTNKTWLNNPLRCDPAIRTALRVLFEFAKDQDEYAGSGRFGHSMKDYSLAMLMFDPCRNDREYGAAARKCGAAMDLPIDDLCFVRRWSEVEGIDTPDSGVAAGEV